MAKVVTFGELMLRLAPNGYYRFFQNDQMQATFGGGEANVSVSLANFGLETTYVTKLPKHAIGQAAVDSLRYFGVDTSKIVRGGDRVGIYFLEKGAWKRARPSAAASASTTGPTPPFRRQILPSSTGTPSSRAPAGSTSPASLRLLAPIWSRPARTPARPPRPMA